MITSIQIIILTILWMRGLYENIPTHNTTITENQERSQLVQLLGLPAIGQYSSRCIEEYDVDWDAVKRRLSSHPLEATEKDGYFTPLTIALLNQRNPVRIDVVAMLVNLNKKALDLTTLVSTASSNPYVRQETIEYLLEADLVAFTKENLRLTQLMYYVSKYGSIGAVRAVARRFPEFLVEFTPGGVQSLPLHIAMENQRPEIVQFLLEEDLKMVKSQTNSSTHDINFDSSVLSQADGYGKLPVDIAIERFQERKCSNLAWKCLTICLQAMDSLRSGYTCAFYDIPVVHAAIGFVPLTVFKEIIDLQGILGIDEFGDSILIKAITVASTMSVKFELNYDWERSSVFSLILNHADGQQVTKKKDCKGRFPIHFAAMRGLQWQQGMKEIVLADYDNLRERDTITNLSSFMLSAENCTDLSTTFTLLREDPIMIG